MLLFPWLTILGILKFFCSNAHLVPPVLEMTSRGHHKLNEARHGNTVQQAFLFSFSFFTEINLLYFLMKIVSCFVCLWFYGKQKPSLENMKHHILMWEGEQEKKKKNWNGEFIFIFYFFGPLLVNSIMNCPQAICIYLLIMWRNSIRLLGIIKRASWAYQSRIKLGY